MGIENIGISFLGSSSTDSKAGVRVRPGEDPSAIYIKWTTQSGTDWQKSFDIAADVAGVPRGLTGAGDYGYGDAKGFWTNFTASECKPVKRSDGLWQWCAPLALGDVGDGELLSVFGPWGFSERTQDALRVRLRLKSNYVDGLTDAWGRTYSDCEYATVWVGWFPEFELTQAWFTQSSLFMEYTSEEWERKDDRFAVELLQQDGSTLLNKDFTWGSVVKANYANRIEVPMSELNRLPSTSSITAKVRINTVFRDSGDEDFVRFSGTVAVKDMTRCSTPRIKAAWEGDSVRVSVTDSKDRSPSFTSCTVKLDGSAYGFDQASCAPGSSVLIKFPPLGKGLSFTAIGYGEGDTVSAKASCTLDAKAATRDLLESIDGTVAIEGKLGLSHKVKGTRNRTELEIEGRPRPVSVYGEGGTVTWTLDSARIVKAGVSGRQDVADFDGLMSCGDCVLRTINGVRRAVGIDDWTVDTSWPFWTATASISVSEVDYD